MLRIKTDKICEHLSNLCHPCPIFCYFLFVKKKKGKQHYIYFVLFA